MTWIEEIIKKYIHLDNKLEKVQGASDEEIDNFEKMAGVCFPDSYKLFLQACGKNDGGLLDGIRAFTDIDNLVICYSELKDEIPDEFPEPDWFIIGVGYEGIDLIMNANSGVVHESSFGEVCEFYADSFVKLVNQEVFKKFTILQSNNTMIFSASAKSVFEKMWVSNRDQVYNILFSICSKYGVVIEELTDSIRIYGESENLFYACTIASDGGVIFMIGGDNYDVIKEFSNEISKSVGATKDN